MLTILKGPYLDLRLKSAVDRNDAVETEYYLSAGADPNAYNVFGTPLILLAASRWGRKAWAFVEDDRGRRYFPGDPKPRIDEIKRTALVCCRLLLDHGAAIDISTPHCPPALVLACEHKQVSAVRLLIERGAAVNVVHHTDEGGDITPLQAATDWETKNNNSSTEVMSLLLDQGANPNVPLRRSCYPWPGWYTCTPLGTAVFSRHLPAVRLLLEHGAYVDRGNSFQHGLRDRALGRPPLLELLRVRSKATPEKFDSQCRILKLLLSFGANIFRPVYDGTNELCVPLTFVRAIETYPHRRQPRQLSALDRFTVAVLSGTAELLRAGSPFRAAKRKPEGPRYDTHQAARINAIFDATVLAHCIVASRRYAYASSARRRVFDHPYLPNEIAGYLGLKARC